MRRTFATFALASSSLRAHKISRSLTTSPATLNEQESQFSSATIQELSSILRSPDPSTVSRGTPPLLQPYELSRRLIELCKQGDVDLAIDMLQRAPKNAQNIKVWNTLIQHCMDAKKYKLASRVFTDMKRRGFMPNIRTYASMMSGYATVDDWGPLTKQLKFADSVYGQLKQHLQDSRNVINDPTGETDASLILYPIALYISTLGKAGKYQKAFDVFHQLDTDGPLAPHPKVYSSLLCVLADRVDSSDAEVMAQTVSDAKYVWRRHMRSLDRQPDHYIESRSVEAIIQVLSRGEASDHELMFDILRNICGLPHSRHTAGEDDENRRLSPPPPPPPPSPPKVELNRWILREVLDSCTAAGRPDMAVYYAQSVMDTPKLRPILRAWHLHKLLRAHLLLAEEGSTSPARSESVAAWVEWMVEQAGQDTSRAPNKHTLTFALELCYRCEDVGSALRIARVMLEGPMQGSMPTKAWAHLLRLAIVASPNDKWRCLELLNRYDSVLDVWESGSAVERLGSQEKRAHVSLALCVVQVLRNAAPPSLDPDGVEEVDTAELDRYKAWSDLRRRAESFLKMARADS